MRSFRTKRAYPSWHRVSSLQRVLRQSFSASWSSSSPMIRVNLETIERLAAKVSPRTLELVKNSFYPQEKADNRSPMSSTSSSQRQRATAVYTNRELDLGNISVIGFDYDYTLASYKTALQHLIYNEAKKYLLHNAGYPSQLSSLSFEKDFCIRGLIFDRNTGMLLKLSFFNRVTPGHAYLGRRQVSYDQLVAIYGVNLHITSDYMMKHCVWVNDLFSLSEACLLADVVQLALDNGIDFDPYALEQDVQKAIAHVHSSGIMHGTVAEDPASYLHSNSTLKLLLQQWQKAGKELFLLTNSAFPFVNAGMKYLLGDDWQQYFDIVATDARKPTFFSSETPFRCLDPSNPESSFAMWHPVSKADLQNVLVGGNVTRLSELAGWDNENVLYFGDHLHADLVQPRKMKGWYTGAIIRELENEFQVQQTDDYEQLLSQVHMIEDLLRDVQDNEEAHTMNTDSKKTFCNGSLQALLDALESSRMEILYKLSLLYNQHFGSIFRAHGDPSAYGFALFKNCDIYTTRIENFLYYPSTHRFYSRHTEHLPHEKIIPRSSHLVASSMEGLRAPQQFV